MPVHQQHGDALGALFDADDRAGACAYLTSRSGLPGRRADLGLMATVADLAPPDFLLSLAESADEYLRCCGTVGLGRLLVEDRAAGPLAPDAVLALLLARAADPLWRVREAVAMALQRVGDAHPGELRAIVTAWVAHPQPLVRRAAVAGICEPRLLHDPDTAETALQACATATAAITAATSGERRAPDVRTLRQALGYCWSVAVAADPVHGLPMWRTLRADPDPDAAWIVRENEKKARLVRVLSTLDAPHAP